MPTTDQSQRYFSRELSWLEFNQRVLEQATSKETPLLERVKFLAITGSNLDEFFMVRVGGLIIQNREQPNKVDISGRSAAEQLEAIRQRVGEMVDDQYACLNNQLLPQLADQGIRRLTREEITAEQEVHLRRVFDEEIASVISPIAVRNAEDFPSLIGASLAVCVRLRGPTLVSDGIDDDSPDDSRCVVLPVRRGVQRIITLPSGSGVHFVMVEDVLAMFADQYFPEQEILEAVPFRTIRNGDVTVDEEAADLLAGMQAMLVQRRTSDCVRLEIDAHASD
ncbi:MAG: polyphosphate kinase 1, partial [Pirellulaceae bacterium]